MEESGLLASVAGGITDGTATTSLAKSAPASLMEQQKISIFLASMNALEEKFTFGVASGEVEFNFPNVFVDVLGENAPE
ncbi:hypothetical protein QR680_016936 [Steinernema hermaphroditum]|uniref:Uncharacterized protein n=1 Tax=Steinernema hermaphroditum TaxID=289476 RepID=A0AA39HDX1_9BILA|nr:hypothetical protein QR680_016936 [Steinernema hermaphroditum]